MQPIIEVVQFFFKHFFVSAFLIASVSTLVKYVSPVLGGFLHGALPITFTYIYSIAHFNKGVKGAKNMAKSALISTPIWATFIFSNYLLAHKGLFYSLGCSTILFLGMVYVYYTNFLKIEMAEGN